MTEITRLHEKVLIELLRRRCRIIFLTGPHRVGKSVPCRALGCVPLDWDDLSHRRLILLGPEAVAEHLGLPGARSARGHAAVIELKNLHRFRKWRGFLNALAAHSSVRVLVTGTVGIDEGSRVWRPAGCRSSMLRVHPWSVAECAHRTLPPAPIRAPAPIEDADWDALLRHGGFPEPFVRRDAEFTRHWCALQQGERLKEDLRSLGALRDPDTAQVLVGLLAQQSAASLVYSDLSRQLGVAVDTVRRWVDLAVRLQLGFRLRPWSARVPKALRREPRWFTRDWSGIQSEDARRRTFIACHLLKAVEGWTDLGFGHFGLFYVRDKVERGVDFLVVRDRRPWFLVHVASGPVPDALGYLQRCTGADHAFQVVQEASFREFDCFTERTPTAVPARTLLSQLL